MSVWRRKASALFPELTKDLGTPDWSRYEFFSRLGALAVEAHQRRDEAVLGRIHGFAEWCLHQSEELWRDAGIGFYEDLFAEVPWAEIVPWPSPFVVAQIKRTWALGVGGERAGELDELVRARRTFPYRTHAFTTGEIEAL